MCQSKVIREKRPEENAVSSVIEQRENVREVDNQEYLGMLKELILDGKEVSLIVTGSSMSPFIIHKRDSVLLAPVNRPLKKRRYCFFPERKCGLYPASHLPGQQRWHV